MDILRAVGAEVVVTPTNVEPEDPQSYYSVAKRLNKEIPNSFYPNQYDNLSNRQAHYETTGPEIWKQSEGKVTHFVAGMGTCGTIVGISKYLKEKNPSIQTVGIDTYGSLFQKLHETGKIDPKEVYAYLTEGIGEDFVPQNNDMSVIDKILKVADKDAALMARKLAKMEGLFVGWSSGSAVHGAIEYAKTLTSKDIVVVILPDHGTRYLGKVYNDAWMRDHGFLEEGTFLTAEQILKQKGKSKGLLAAQENQTLGDAILLMQKENVSQLPVLNSKKQISGSVNESRLLNALMDDPEMKKSPIQSIMNEPFPFVLGTTRIDSIGKMISKDNAAVLVQLSDGSLDIITKYDLIYALTGSK